MKRYAIALVFASGLLLAFAGGKKAGITSTLRVPDQVATFYGAAHIAPGMTAGDMFGRLRVSAPTTIFDSKQIADSQALIWDDDEVSGSGTSSAHDTDNASTDISVSNATAGFRVRQTFTRPGYQPGKSQLGLQTYVLDTEAVGLRQAVGQFDDSNGIFFEIDGTTRQWCIRSDTSGSPVDTCVAQASWDDPLDGTGRSGHTLDPDVALIQFIQFEWLGVGSVVVGWVINTEFVVAHQFDHANQAGQTTVYMSTPNLPVRYEIQNDGAGPAATLKHICATVISEGGQNETGFPRSVDRGTTAFESGASVTTNFPLIVCRLRSGYEGARIRLSEVSLQTVDSSSLRWAVNIGGTIGGTAPTYAAIPNSPVECDLGLTNATTIADGTEIASGYYLQTNQSAGPIKLKPQDFSPGVDRDGTAQVFALTAQSVTSADEDFYASLDWVEVY